MTDTTTRIVIIMLLVMALVIIWGLWYEANKLNSKEIPKALRDIPPISVFLYVFNPDTGELYYKGKADSNTSISFAADPVNGNEALTWREHSQQKYLSMQGKRWKASIQFAPVPDWKSFYDASGWKNGLIIEPKEPAKKD